MGNVVNAKYLYFRKGSCCYGNYDSNVFFPNVNYSWFVIFRGFHIIFSNESSLLKKRVPKTGTISQSSQYNFESDVFFVFLYNMKTCEVIGWCLTLIFLLNQTERCTFLCGFAKYNLHLFFLRVILSYKFLCAKLLNVSDPDTIIFALLC